ncbi:L,D-transpeptidase family protein [Schaalia vaccimaxillae]|uniref:L,D-transpeptidase family protein n=1 Tax=Schaalia vaccimaxillae TaxID=183916 RepID=UPI0003B5998D|nr:L,D-transpeptidase family protein [Schaalia vaccimaxillae]
MPIDGSLKLWIGGAAAVVTLGLVGGGTAYALHYDDVALPRTSVAGESVSGLTRAEVEAQIAQRAKDTLVTVDVAGVDTQFSLTDLGVKVDEVQTADAVFAANSSVLKRFTALVSATQTPVVVSVDDATIAERAEELARHAGPAVVQAQPVLSSDGVSFTVSPGVPGKGIDAGELKKIAVDAGAQLVASTHELDAQDVQPTVTDEQAKALAAEANKLVASAVTVTDGIDTFEADAATKAGWIVFPKPVIDDPAGQESRQSSDANQSGGEDQSADKAQSGDVDKAGAGSAQAQPVAVQTVVSGNASTVASVAVDPQKVSEWVEATAESTNVPAKPGVRNVNAAGEVLVESIPGTKGLRVINAEEVRDEIVAAVSAGKPYEGDFDYEDVEPEFEDKPVMAGHEGYVYPMHEGEKWVDINLSASTLTAYEGQTVVHGPVAMNHGGPGYETVTGTYHVYLKYQKQDMGCTPEWPYCAKDVPWVSYFTGSYAMHGAPWVSQFGIGSDRTSHGCINLPVGEAKWMYDWNELGTAVVTHH